VVGATIPAVSAMLRPACPTPYAVKPSAIAATPASAAELSALRGSASYVSNPPDPGVWPPKPKVKPKPKPKKPADGPLVRQARRAEHVLAVARNPKRRAAAARRLAKRALHGRR